MTQNITLINADVIDGLKSIDKDSVDTVVTSPPYWSLRDYQADGQIGMESTIEEYHDRLLEVTAELKRVMKPTAVLFWNHGDSYGGNQERGEGKGNESEQMVPQKAHAPKCLTMQNERLIIRMIDEQGFILRNRIIWHKSNGMPPSVKDRFTNAYESVYMLTKESKYHFDLDAVRIPYTEPMNRWGGSKLKAVGTAAWDEGTGQKIYRDREMRPNNLGKNPGDVWKIPTLPHKYAHFAIMPDKLAIPMIKAGCPRNGIVLDPFAGSGTTMKNAKALGRSTIGIELSPEYCDIIKRNLLFHQHTFSNIVNEFVKL